MKGRTVVAFVVAAAVGVMAFIFVEVASVSRHGVKVGVTPASACTEHGTACLPAIQMKDTSGHTWEPSTLAGKVVMINFWATWCHPCRAEIPTLARSYAKHKGQGFVLIGVMADDPTHKALAQFVKRTGLDYPIVHGTSEIFRAFGNPDALPTTFIYDRGGHLKVHKRGGFNDATLEADLGKLLAEPAPGAGS